MITAAAAIMVAVFLAFLVSDEMFLKLLGVGMATAIWGHSGSLFGGHPRSAPRPLDVRA